MNYSLQTFWLYILDRVILLGLGISLVATQVSVWLLWFKIPDLPNEVPLWYTAAPIHQLAEVQLLWIIPGVATASLLINVVLGLWLYRRYAAVSRMLAVVSAGVGVLTMVAVIKTILIFTEIL